MVGLLLLSTTIKKILKMNSGKKLQVWDVTKLINII